MRLSLLLVAAISAAPWLYEAMVPGLVQHKRLRSSRRRSQAASRQETLLEPWEQILEASLVTSARPEGAGHGFISTHDGTFQPDEVMACALLKSLPEFAALPIVRSRDPAVIGLATAAVDVGFEFDPDRLRFDHHQPHFTEGLFGVKLASAGLIWRHFGKSILDHFLGPGWSESLFQKVYEVALSEIDSIDNGGMTSHRSSFVSVAARILNLRRSWQEQNATVENENFRDALVVAARYFYDVLGNVTGLWLPATWRQSSFQQAPCMSSATTLKQLQERLAACDILSEPPAVDLPVIWTRDGAIEADEVVACMLLKWLPQYATHPILRSAKKPQGTQVAVAVGVGGILDHEQHLYDHWHFKSTFSPASRTPLGAVGLIWKHFGEAILSELVDNVTTFEKSVLFRHFYRKALVEFDSVTHKIWTAGPGSLISQIQRLNPPHLQAVDRPAQFKEALHHAADAVYEPLQWIVAEWLVTLRALQGAHTRRFEVHSSGEILKLSKAEAGATWPDCLLFLEEEDSQTWMSPSVKFVVYPEKAGKWRLKAARKSWRSRESRVPLPRTWRGLANSELEAASGLKGALFVHPGGFTGGHETEEGIVTMAVQALHTAQQRSTAR